MHKCNDEAEETASSSELNVALYFVGKKKVYNLVLRSGNVNDAAVFGQVTLKRYPNHEIRAYSDTYNFEMHNWFNPLNWPRNFQTFIGGKVAGEGVNYEINIYGSAKLKPIFSWLK